MTNLILNKTPNIAKICELDDLIKEQRPGWSLPQPFYDDQKIFNLDMERIFRRGWLFVGHVSQLSKIGDYFNYEIDGESLIIIRDRENAIRALYNVCRHRGS